MGQQQLFAVIIGVIVVGIAVAVGLNLLRAHRVEANQEEIVLHLRTIAQDAMVWTEKPPALGGGDGDYSTYAIPPSLASTAEGTFTIVRKTKGAGKGKGKAKGKSKGTLVLLGTSTLGFGTVTMTLGDDLVNATFEYTGDFK